MYSCTQGKTCIHLNKGYDDKTMEEAQTIEFLGLQIDSNFNWKTHTAYIIPN
jgi:hypothetical protein